MSQEDSRYRAVDVRGCATVFEVDRLMAECPGGSADAERIAAALNEMEEREDGKD